MLAEVVRFSCFERECNSGAIGERISRWEPPHITHTRLIEKRFLIDHICSFLWMLPTYPGEKISEFESKYAGKHATFMGSKVYCMVSRSISKSVKMCRWIFTLDTSHIALIPRQAVNLALICRRESCQSITGSDIWIGEL